MNSLGQFISFTTTTLGKEISILPAAKLKSGIYFIELLNNNGQNSVHKVIVN